MLVLSSHPKKYWQALAVLVASVFATVFAWQMISARMQRDVQERFGFETQLVTTRISERLASSVLVLRGAAGLFSANGNVTRAAWRRYVWELNLEQMRGTQMMGFVRYVPKARLDDFEQEVRADGYGDFAVKPPGDRESSAVLQYIEPFSAENQKAFGLDLRMALPLREALDVSRDTGRPYFSEKLSKLPGSVMAERPSLMAFYPVYSGRQVPQSREQRREVLLGWICLHFRMQELMEVLQVQQLPGVRLEIFDGESTGLNQLLFDTHAGKGAEIRVDKSVSEKVSHLQLDGRLWTLRYTALADYSEQARFDSGWTILVGMLIISFLLSGMTWAWLNTREHAQSIAGRLTATLRSSEERYRSIFGLAGVTALLVDPHERKVIEANTAAVNYYGIPAVDMRGMPIERIVEGDELLLSGALQEALLGHRNQMFQRHRLKSGQLREVEVHTSPMSLDGRELLYCVVHDVTERHEAQEAVLELNQRYQSLLDAASEVSIIATDRSGMVTLFNRGAERLLGFRAVDVVERISAVAFHTQEEINQRGQTLSTTLGYPIAGYQALVEVPLVHGSEQREWNYVRRDGSRCRVSLSVTPVRGLEGSVVGYLLIALDISRLKEVEASLVQARDAAEQASRAKSTFLATMSHEIRTPMNGVIGMAQLLQHTTLSDEQREYAAIIMSSAESLLTIINDILDFSKVEAGKLSVEHVPLDLHRLVNEVSTMLTPQAQSRGLVLRTDVEEAVPRWVLGDPVRLRQILVNLMGNAVKFTQHGGITVTIKCPSKNSNGAEIELHVSDSGVGMSPQVVEGLFAPFYQADTSVTRRFGGTGLGLSITHGLVVLMGGRIVVESMEDKGSTFVVYLHLGVADAQPEIAEQAVRATLPGKARILVVDDTPANQMVALQMLRKLGLVAVTADNGEMAIKKLSEENFDLVLMDCQMPVMDGFTATQMIRAGKCGELAAGIPIIAMTANAVAGDRERCLEAGMSDYLAKPVALDMLVSQLQRWLQGVSSQPDVIVTGAAAKKEPQAVIFDSGELMRNCGRDRTLADIIIDAAVGDMPGFLARMEVARAEGHVEQMHRLAHTTKGLAAQISGKHMSALALHIEAEAKEGRLPTVSQLDELKEAYRLLLGELENFRG